MMFHSFEAWDVSDEEYHAAHHVLGSTGIKRLVYPNPPPVEDLALRLGIALHLKVFDQPGHDKVEMEPPNRGTGAKKRRDEFFERVQLEGVLHLPETEFTALPKMRDAVMRVPGVERSLNDPDVLVEQPWKFRIGHLLDGKRKIDAEIPHRLLWDLKTTKHLDRHGYRKDFMALGYHVQIAYYNDTGVELHGGEYEDGVFHVVVSSKPNVNGDHMATLVEVPPETIKLGRDVMAAGLELAEARRAFNLKPRFPFETPHKLEPPKPWERDEVAALVHHIRRSISRAKR